MLDMFASPRSLARLAELFEEHDCYISLVGQAPFSVSIGDMIMDKAERAGFVGGKYTMAPAETPPRMAWLRELAARAFRDADYFIFVDDNFEFSEGTPKYPRSSGRRYAECIEYLEAIESAGMVMCEGSLGGNYQKWKIAPMIKNHYVHTARGLVIKNVFRGPVFDDHQQQLRGAFEETLLAANLLTAGYFIAKQFNNPTSHKDRKKVSPGSASALHDLCVAKENVLKYFSDEYGATFQVRPGKRMAEKRIPKLSAAYALAGGPDVNDPSFTIDFEEQS